MNRNSRIYLNGLLIAIAALFIGRPGFILAEDDTNLAPAAVVTQAGVLRKVHLINLTEIKAGKLAKVKGLSKRIRSFGVRLVKDHTAADKLVQDTAKREKIDVTERIPSVDDEMIAMEKDMMATLESTTGSDFDQAFAKAMYTGHRDAIAFLEDAKTQLRGTRTARLIDTLLPTIRLHERIAKRLVRRLAE